MKSAYDVILETVILARLLDGGDLVSDMSNVRRAHTTLVPELPDGSPRVFAVHLLDGDDEPDGRAPGGKCGLRRGEFRIALFGRSDAGPTVIDDLKVEVNRRLDPEVEAYPPGITIRQGRITIEQDDANADAIRVEMAFSVGYQTESEWSLLAL